MNDKELSDSDKFILQGRIYPLDCRPQNGHAVFISCSLDARYAVSGAGSASVDKTLRLWEVSFPLRGQEYKHPYPVLSLVRPFLQLATERESVGDNLKGIKDSRVVPT